MGSLRQATVLEGVIVSGNAIFNEPQKTLALGAAWQDTFSVEPFNYEKSNSIQ